MTSAVSSCWLMSTTASQLHCQTYIQQLTACWVAWCSSTSRGDYRHTATNASTSNLALPWKRSPAHTTLRLFNTPPFMVSGSHMTVKAQLNAASGIGWQRLLFTYSCTRPLTDSDGEGEWLGFKQQHCAHTSFRVLNTEPRFREIDSKAWI